VVVDPVYVNLVSKGWMSYRETIFHTDPITDPRSFWASNPGKKRDVTDSAAANDPKRGRERRARECIIKNGLIAMKCNE
jgi:hypothetical protein